jgi:hypothetical protein
MSQELVVVNALRVAVAAGGSTVALEVAGASAAALSASTLIVATGGAAALVLVGLGLYKSLSR